MRTNPEKYKWGIFYFDPKDTRIFVPKGQVLPGWTINFGNRLSYFVISVIVALLFLINYIAKP